MEDLYHMRSSQDEPKTNEAQTLDALLADVRALLDSDGAEPAALSQQEAEADAPVTEEQATDDDGELFSTQESPESEPEPQQPLTYYEQSKPAYQRARRAEYERVKEQQKQQRAQRRQAFEREGAARKRQQRQEMKRGAQKSPHRSAEEYAQWLYAQGLSEQEQQERVQQEQRLTQSARGRRTRRARRTAWRLVVVLVLLLAAAAAAFQLLLVRQPQAEPALSERSEGCSTILVAGTDAGGYRTDSMLLLNVDREQRAIRLVSIPRDTLIYCEYSIPKLNSAYGWAGGGDDGMQELLLRITEITGFTPDGYVVVELDVFRELVDLMGGIQFDVPVDMHYADPTQNLVIDLQAGEQLLDGAKAMQVARFRSGYATADLGRIEVQRSLVSAALEQWVSVKGLLKLKKAVTLVTEHTNTDLSAGNLLWLAESLLICDRSGIESATMPGHAADFASGSYYVLDAEGVAELVNTMLSPYEEPIRAEELSIRVG